MRGYAVQNRNFQFVHFMPLKEQRSMVEKPVYLTREGREKLQAELESLFPRRKEVAARIAQAKDLGDLSENSEYEAARNEQSFIVGRIREIEYLLSRAQIIEEGTDSDKAVRLGSRVT